MASPTRQAIPIAANDGPRARTSQRHAPGAGTEVDEPGGVARTPSAFARWRPAKVRGALRRRSFELRVPRMRFAPAAGLAHLGSAYGGWILPVAMIEPSWTCYMVGAGGDVAVDLELVREHGATVRCFDAVARFVELAGAEAGGLAGFSAHHAAIAAHDGPIRMQLSHDPRSSSVSAAGLYDSDRYVELPGRTLPSLMAELGDERIDLLKLDVEGSEYELLPQIDLRAFGVKVFAIQLHHTGTVADARALIGELRRQGYQPVACRPAVKVTFVRSDLL